MYGLTEIEVYEDGKRWRFRIVSGKNNTPRCISTKSYKSGNLAYAAAERFAKLEVNKSPRFYNLP